MYPYTDYPAYTGGAEFAETGEIAWFFGNREEPKATAAPVPPTFPSSVSTISPAPSAPGQLFGRLDITLLVDFAPPDRSKVDLGESLQNLGRTIERRVVHHGVLVLLEAENELR